MSGYVDQLNLLLAILLGYAYWLSFLAILSCFSCRFHFFWLSLLAKLIGRTNWLYSLVNVLAIQTGYTEWLGLLAILRTYAGWLYYLVILLAIFIGYSCWEHLLAILIGYTSWL